jgi:periplasmic protein CpxP/Spy
MVMDYIKKNKFLTAVVAILVVLNLAVVAYVFFFFKPPSLLPGPNARGERFRLIDERLNLSEEQKAKFKELRQDEFATMDSTAHARFQAMRDLFSLLKNEKTNPEEVQQKVTVIGALDAEQAARQFRHFQALRALCTPEQQKEFDRIVIDAMTQARGMRGGMGRRGPGPADQGFDGPDLPPGASPPAGGPPPGEAP